MTTITTMPKGMKIKFSRNFEEEDKLNQRKRPLHAGCHKRVTTIS